MRFCFLTRGPDPGVTEAALITNMKAGMLRHGDDIAWAQTDDAPTPAGCDGLLFFGIAMRTRRLMFARHERVVMLDKGYTRAPHFRVSINDDQPLAYFQRAAHPSDRWDDLGFDLEIEAASDARAYLLVDGASIKFCAWKELGYVELWGQHIIEKIRTVTDEHVVYRPRPDGHRPPIVPRGWAGDYEVDHGSYDMALDRAKVVVTYGGNMGFDAVLRWLPVFAIGNSIARPLAETDWLRIGQERGYTERQRDQWLHDVAYCQWTLKEMETGEMWACLKEEMRYL